MNITGLKISRAKLKKKYSDFSKGIVLRISRIPLNIKIT